MENAIDVSMKAQTLRKAGDPLISRFQCWLISYRPEDKSARDGAAGNKKQHTKSIARCDHEGCEYGLCGVRRTKRDLLAAAQCDTGRRMVHGNSRSLTSELAADHSIEPPQSPLSFCRCEQIRFVPTHCVSS